MGPSESPLPRAIFETVYAGLKLLFRGQVYSIRADSGWRFANPIATNNCRRSFAQRMP
jgi:hypothetical protein